MIELDQTKEYVLRAKVGEKYVTMISCKTNDNGSPVIGINPALIELLNKGKWGNLYFNTYDKKEQSRPSQSSNDLNDEVPF